MTAPITADDVAWLREEVGNLREMRHDHGGSEEKADDRYYRAHRIIDRLALMASVAVEK
jgi:hypothetical protein